METDQDVDEPMEIDDTVPAGTIIERKIDDCSFLNETTGKLTRTGDDASTADTEELETAAEPKKKGADVVVLLDDDDEDAQSKTKKTAKARPEKESVIDLVEKSMHGRCMNLACKSKCQQFLTAPDFCLSYYRVKQSKSHFEEICEDCYDQSVLAYDKLANNLQDGKLILGVNLPIINETLQIDDSDEEEDQTPESLEYLDEQNFKFIEENIESVLEEALRVYGVDTHMQKETEQLRLEATKTEESINEISTSVKNLRKALDGIQLDLYNQFRPDLRELKGLSIIDDASSSAGTIVRVENVLPPTQDNIPGRKILRQPKQMSQLESNNLNKPMSASQDRIEPPANLPVFGIVEKPAPKVSEIYYIAREGTVSGSWVRARMQASILPGKEYNGQIYSMTSLSFRLIELKKQKERIVNGKQIAYMTFCNVRLSIGTRVLAVFKEEGMKGRTYPYYPGVIGEAPYDGNKYRYLIFFDIGYAQYVDYLNVHLIYEASKNVWEDMSADSRPFIKKYLESQFRPMVKLAKDQTVRTEYNGKWWLCTVKNVDCSLVQVFFDHLNRLEWIYRGSTRLSPMFREEQAANNRHSGVRTSRKAGPNESATVVQYTRTNDCNTASPEKPTETKESGSVRAVARKSTTRIQPGTNIVPFLPPVINTPPNVAGPTSKIMYFTPRDSVITKRIYKPHSCGPRCKEFLTHNINKLRGHNPLSKPLLCGFARLTVKQKCRKEIVYKAPCGRMLRNIAEVHLYLRTTRSEMTVDLFDFNHMVRCLAEFSVECKPDPIDLSKGLEQVPIPVINGVNNDMLDFCNYSTKRVPMEGVHMNLDKEFLCGCDCEDDCIDKTKCACWKLTLEGTKFIGKDLDPNSIGYIYRRLQEQVITGIYECNSRCKCNSTCLNRVVQNPMSLKLQVFRTHNRGWGIRCLNDVPQGSFICIYAGTLHTEQMANEDGMAYGDEYFAELDYIETVEKFKEDYEAEALEDDDDERSEKSHRGSPDPDEDDFDEFRKGMGKYRRYSDDNDYIATHKVRHEIKEYVPTTGIKTRGKSKRYDDEDYKFETKIEKLPTVESVSSAIDTVTISDDEDEGREVLSFNPKTGADLDDKPKYPSVRDIFGPNEDVYIMDAKTAGNIGRFLNHSCSPNVFVQNVFVDTQDPRFPWVSFFSSQFIRAGTELTWNYNYDIGSVPGRVLYCHCASLECKGRLL